MQEPNQSKSVSGRRRGGRRLSLRATLITLIVGLLLVTSLAIGLVAFTITSASIDKLTRSLFDEITRATEQKVRRHLEPAIEALAEYRIKARRGLLPLDDMERLGELLAERLRQQRTLAWLSWGNAKGQFVGAWRRKDDAIVINRSWRIPAPAGETRSRRIETVIDVDGRRQRIRDDNTKYDPRDRPWYKLASRSRDGAWTKPYPWHKGELGVTYTVAVRREGKVIGAFTADFRLADLSRFLSRLEIGKSGRAFLVTRGGRLLAGPDPKHSTKVTPALARALIKLRSKLTRLPPHTPLQRTFDHAGETHVTTAEVFELGGGLELAALIIAPRSDFLGGVYRNARWNVAIGILALLIAIVLGALTAYWLAGPLRDIALDLSRIGEFELTPDSAPDSRVSEIASVGESVTKMKAGLRSFQRYVPTDVVRDLLASGEEAKLGGRSRVLTIHFSDIAGFTRICENLSPAEIVIELSEYLEGMTTVLRDAGGTVDKFMGDGILAFFNAPRLLDVHATRACESALQAQRMLRDLAQRWESQGRPVFRARIGLHTGEVLVGNIGTNERFAYTVIGDAVNVASRLEALNKEFGTAIMASQETREEAGDGFEWRRLDRVAVVGRVKGMLVHELLGRAGETDDALLEARDRYEEAFERYLAREFAAAADGFAAALALRPRDKAAILLEARCRDLAANPPGKGWRGVYQQVSK